MQTERAAPGRRAGHHHHRHTEQQKLLTGAGAYAGLLLVLWSVAQFFHLGAL